MIGLLLIIHCTQAQSEGSETEIRVSVNNFLSGDNGQPFWLHANRFGKVDKNEANQGLLTFSANKKYVLDSKSEKYWEGGFNLLGRYYGNETVRLQEYWGRFNYKGFYFHAGAKGEPKFNNGLSITNGNLYLSNNARPLPRVEFGIKSFRPFSGDSWEKLSFSGLYSEYFLLDDRHISNAHLHHKNFGINYKFSSSWTFSLAFDHWVFWGGEFPNGEDIPDFEYYLKYIFGKKGGEKSKITEQQNASGNHTGQYQFSINHLGEHGNLDLYWQHPWEDGTGLKFKNISDGLWGFSYQSYNNQAFLNGIVLEYVNTKHQSGRTHDSVDPDHLGEFIGGGDNYFNHHIYRSGYTSYGRMIGLPLLIPSENEVGISTGFQSNRLWAVHSGLSGNINNQFTWKALLTYSKHYGTHANPFSSSKDLFSAGLSLLWERDQNPFSYCMNLAIDRGDYLPKTEGIELGITYHLNRSK